MPFYFFAKLIDLIGLIAFINLWDLINYADFKDFINLMNLSDFTIFRLLMDFIFWLERLELFYLEKWSSSCLKRLS